MKTLILTLALLLVSAPGYAEEGHAISHQTMEQSTPHHGQREMSFKRVENDKVCMVTNKVFKKAQIPVTIGEQTYYGCCSMCKGKLEKDTSVRLAIDPVSGNEVDKATAVIGADSDGEVQYFESEENLDKYAHEHM